LFNPRPVKGETEKLLKLVLEQFHVFNSIATQMIKHESSPAGRRHVDILSGYPSAFIGGEEYNHRCNVTSRITP